MKKLGKLTINPEKVIKNEELVNLRGGTYYQIICDDVGGVPGDYWGCGDDWQTCEDEGDECCPQGWTYAIV